MKKLILYDLDGTLVDTRRDIINSVRYALKALSGPELTDDEIKDCVGTGLHSLIKQVFRTQDDVLADKGAKLYRAHYKEHMLDHSSLYPGAREFLEYFKDRQQAVITNKPNPFSSQILASLGVADHFIAILAGDNGLPFKPDPAAIHHLMETTGSEAGEVLFVGDSPIDIEAARNGGVEVVTLSHGFASEAVLREAKPDHIVRDFSELLRLAKEKGW
ncbi:MAG TPA: HAD-IA family hydrolase [Candidatus Omnitrophota bacterium]|nr:HAD-IA family hydrolase [Candidatus Omnitrophota bacterium]HPS36411.1 HAD-IA family hydrolase [Candidatus Omnitrophota bacterium]